MGKKFQSSKKSKKNSNISGKNKIKKIDSDIPQESNKADFYLDDADADLAYDSSELEEESIENDQDMNEEEEEMSEHGSELDFKEEDYIPSESEEKEEKKKMKGMTKNELKKLMEKVGEGIEVYIVKFLILAGRLTNPNNEYNFEDTEENVLTNNKVINNIIII